MRQLLLAPCLFALVLCVSATDVYSRNDTIPRSMTPSYFTSNKVGVWEEHHLVQALPPCRILGLRFHYRASSLGEDTIHLLSSSRLMPEAPMSEQWGRAAIAYPIIVNITRDSQIVDVDLRSLDIRLNGYEALAISHRTQNSDRVWAVRTGPYVNTSVDTVSFSYTIDRNRSEPMVLPVGAKFCVQVIVEHAYDIPALRVQPQSGSMFAEYNSIAAWKYGSINASVVDLNNDGFDDVMFDSLLSMNRNAGELALRTVFVKPANTYFNADISAWCDVDRDGDMDCLMHDQTTNALRLLRTDSAEHFTDITSTSGIVASGATAVLLWFDAENDGDPDFFVGSEAQDMLWLNNGNGTFTNASVASGLVAAEPAPYDTCGSASLGDINGDGLTDIMVVTRGRAPDRLLLNMGNATFSIVSAPGRIGSASAGSYGNGEGAEWGDVNGDGIDDILVANSVRMGNPSTLQDGSIVWRTTNKTAVMFDTMWTDLGLPFLATTNGYTAADLNLDGLMDFVSVVTDTLNTIADKAYPNILIQRKSGGRTEYLHESFRYGLPVIDAGFAVRTDIDLDGDPDFIVNRTSVLRNNLSNANNGVTLRLRNDDRTSVTKDCFGSMVTVFAGGRSKKVYFPGTVTTGHGSANSAAMNFGLLQATVIDSVVVVFSDKSTRVFRGLDANGAYVLNTSGSVQRLLGAPRQQAPFFNAIEVAAATTFAWSDMGSGITYDLQVSRDSNFFTTSVLRNITGITSLSHTLVDQLPLAQEFLWRIRGRFANGDVTAWSTAWPFTVGKVIPRGLTLVAPPDKSRLYIPEADMQWAHVNDSRQINALTQYNVQLSTSETFDAIDRDTVVDEFKKMSAGGLAEAQTYYWRVRPIQSGVNGEWSSTWTFATRSFPGPIRLLTPPYGAEGVLAKVRLSWHRPEGLDAEAKGTYVMQFALDSLCLDILDTGTTADTIEPGQYLLLDQKYYWRVRLITPFGNGPWSDIWWFKTGFVVDGVDDEDGQWNARAGNTMGAYPMPFSDHVSLRLPPEIFPTEGMRITAHDVNGTLLYDGTDLQLQTDDWPSGPIVLSLHHRATTYRVVGMHLRR